MTADQKSLIIIGAGMTGLSSGLAWAKNNNTSEKPVLIIEKQPKTGGEVTSYERNGYQFDTCQMISNLTDIFKYLGIDVELRAFKGLYMRIFLVKSGENEARVLNLPSGIDGFREHLKKEYPDEAVKIEEFLIYSHKMFKELDKLKYEPTFPELLKTLITCPKIVMNASKNFEDYFNKFDIKNEEVREIFSAFAAMSGLPDNRVAALLPIGVMFSLLEGAFRPRNGFIELPRAMEKQFLDLGGEIRTGTEVKKIMTDDGRVLGVVLSDGEKIYSDNVISTVDTKLAMEKLVGMDIIRERDNAYAEKIESIKMSPSSMNVSLGLDDKIDLAGLGLDCGYNVVTTGGNTFNRLHEAFLKGENAMSEDCFHIGVICPSLTTGTRPNITIRVVPMALAHWMELRKNDTAKYKNEKEKWGNFFIDLVEKHVIPDLKKHIIVKDISTPATYARYNGSPTGSIYDMASQPDNFGRNRLKMRTPIDGLYQPKFAHGVFGTITGGLQVIDMILERKIMDGNSRFSGNK